MVAIRATLKDSTSGNQSMLFMDWEDNISYLRQEYTAVLRRAYYRRISIAPLISSCYILQTLPGSHLLRYATGSILQVFLGLILLVSALKLSRKKNAALKEK